MPRLIGGRNVVAGVTDSIRHLLEPDGTSDPYHTLNSAKCSGL